jgi:hypothetical protein
MVPKLYLGLNDLEHHCRWLYPVWLETALHDPIFWGDFDDSGFFFGLTPAHVVDMYRFNLRRLVAAPAGILKVKSRKPFRLPAWSGK